MFPDKFKSAVHTCTSVQSLNGSSEHPRKLRQYGELSLFILMRVFYGGLVLWGKNRRILVFTALLVSLIGFMSVV